MSAIQEVGFSSAQIASNYDLHVSTTLAVEQDTLSFQSERNNGGDANNQILVGALITNVPAVADLIKVGSGDTTGALANEVMIGDGCAAAGIAGQLSFGDNMAAVGVGAALPAVNPEKWLSINYNGVRYYISLYTTAP